MSNQALQPDEMEPAWETTAFCKLMAKLAMRVAFLKMNGIDPLRINPNGDSRVTSAIEALATIWPSVASELGHH